MINLRPLCFHQFFDLQIPIELFSKLVGNYLSKPFIDFILKLQKPESGSWFTAVATIYVDGISNSRLKVKMFKVFKLFEKSIVLSSHHRKM